MKSLVIIFFLVVYPVTPLFGATEIGPGPVSGDWYASGNPYNINGEIFVSNGQSLRIHEGVEVVFQGHYKFIVFGALEAVGTENAPILFTAANQVDGWHGIRFLGGSAGGQLTWCTIEHGRAIGANEGDPNGWGGGLLCQGSNPIIRHCTFRENSTNWDGGGIFLFMSSSEITDCIFTNNSAGYDGGGGYIWMSTTRLRNCTVSGNHADNDVGGFLFQDSVSTVEDSTFSGNSSDRWGGGVGGVWGGDLTLRRCHIIENSAEIWGGGLAGDGVTMTITDTEIIGNSAGNRGGGIWAYGAGLYGECMFTMINNLICGNTSGEYGGGIGFIQSSTTIINNTIVGNSASLWGGGISCDSGSSMAISNSILWGNDAPTIADEMYIGSLAYPSTVTIDYSSVNGGQDYIFVEPNCILEWGGHMIEDDPLFCTGPGGDYCDYYLSQDPCQPGVVNSCVDGGDPLSELIQGTTRTDLVQDWDVVDIGHHYSREIEPFISVGLGPDEENLALVHVFAAEAEADLLFDFPAYGAPFGVNVTCGDVNINDMDEIITGPGPGPVAGSHVRGFQLDGIQLPGFSFFAYGTPKWGVNVSAGDIDGDGYDEIVTGAGPGAVFGPHVRGWNYDGSGTVTPVAGVSFFAYGTPKWGVNVSCGDIDGDGYDEIVTGAGPGSVYGPHVRAWNVDGGAATTMPGVSFLAYGTNQWGVNVTCGDIDGDGIDEIVTGPGPGVDFGAHVRGWNYDGGTTTPIAGCSFNAFDTVRFGANVYAGADLNGDGRDEIVVGCGPDPNAGTEVRIYRYNGTQISGEDPWFSLEAFPGMEFTRGTNVAAGRF